VASCHAAEQAGRLRFRREIGVESSTTSAWVPVPSELEPLSMATPSVTATQLSVQPQSFSKAS